MAAPQERDEAWAQISRLQNEATDWNSKYCDEIRRNQQLKQQVEAARSELKI